MNTIIFERVSVVKVDVKKDPKTGEAFLAIIRLADSRYRSQTEKEKAKKEGKQTDDFFTLNIWKKEIEKFNDSHKADGQKIEDLVPGCKIKVTGQLKNNNYEQGGKKVYSDVIVADSIEILSFPKAKDEESGEQQSANTSAPAPAPAPAPQENVEPEIPDETPDEIPEEFPEVPEEPDTPSGISNPFEDEDDEELPF